MTQRVEDFPHLKKVCLNIAYDNGMINRFQHEEEFLRSTDQVFGAEDVDYADLKNMDLFCEKLSDEEKETLAAGETEEVAALISRCEAWCPGLGPKLDGLLNDVFDREPEGYRPGWA